MVATERLHAAILTLFSLARWYLVSAFFTLESGVML